MTENKTGNWIRAHQINKRTPTQCVKLRKGARVLGVDIVDGALRLRVLEQQTGETEKYVVHIIKTGEPVPPNCGEYVGHFFLSDWEWAFMISAFIMCSLVLSHPKKVKANAVVDRPD